MTSVFISYVLFTRKRFFKEESLFHKCSEAQIQRLDSGGDADGPGVMLERHKTAEFPPPPDEALAYFGRGLTADSIRQLKKTKVAIQLTGIGPFDPEHRLLKTLTVAVGRMAVALDAFVVDRADSMTFTPAAFQGLRVDELERGELSPSQFGTRAYRVDGGLRGVTMGLEKFGQRNVGVAWFAEHHMNPMQSLMTLMMQHFIEADSRLEPGRVELDAAKIRTPSVRAELAHAMKDHATGKASLEFADLEPSGGDPQDLMGPVFASPPGDALTAEHEALLGRLLGATSNVSQGVSFEQLAEAIAQARERAIAILSDQAAWTTPGRQFRLAIELPGTQEVCWLEVKSWEGKQGSGILLSSPRTVDGLKSGASCDFAAEMIMDYRLTDPEREIEAGGIDELVKKLQSDG